MRKKGAKEQPKKSCNYSFTTFIFPADSPIGPDRTRLTVTHAGTAHVLFTGEWPFFFKDNDPNVACPLSLQDSEQVEKRQQRQGQREAGFTI